LKADFKSVILVHGIALQGTGPVAHWATLEYTISYTYNSKLKIYTEGKFPKVMKVLLEIYLVSINKDTQECFYHNPPRFHDLR